MSRTQAVQQHRSTSAPHWFSHIYGWPLTVVTFIIIIVIVQVFSSFFMSALTNRQGRNKWRHAVIGKGSIFKTESLFSYFHLHTTLRHKHLHALDIPQGGVFGLTSYSGVLESPAEWGQSSPRVCFSGRGSAEERVCSWGWTWAPGRCWDVWWDGAESSLTDDTTGRAPPLQRTPIREH